MAKTPNWTEGDLKILRALAGTVGAPEIGRRLGRSVYGVQTMMQRLGLRGLNRGEQVRPWTSEEIAVLLRENAAGKSARAIGIILGRSNTSVGEKRTKLGLNSLRHREWTESEIASVYEAVGVLTVKELAMQLGRQEGALRSKCKVLDVSLNVRAMNGNYRLWSVQQESTLRELAATLTPQDIAKRVGRTVAAVKRKAIALGLGVKWSYSPRGTGGGCGRPRAAGTEMCSRSKRQPRAAKPVKRVRPRRERTYISRLVWCVTCGCPVVNTYEGHAGHRERVGCKLIVRTV
jgi:hypothetical protein